MKEITNFTMGELLREAGRRHGGQTAILDGERRISFRELDAEVDRFARRLLGARVAHGDHVAVWLPNSLEWVVAFFACARIGAPIVPVNARYKRDEVQFVLTQSDAKVLVLPAGAEGTACRDILLAIEPGFPLHGRGELDIPSLPQLKSLIETGVQEERGADSDALSNQTECAVSPDDLLLICYTSGSTGKPKGVMHSHRVIEQATNVGFSLRMQAGDKVLAHMPFYHVAGLFMALVPAVALGATLLPMKLWSARGALGLIERERVTVFGGIPTHYYDLVAAIEKEPRDTSSLKSAWIGGSAVMQATFQRIKDTLGITRLFSTYGMTENTISTTFNAWDDPVEACCNNRAPVLARCDVRIFDPETRTELPVGAVGEICCRGSTVMLGYYKDSDATRDVLTPEGWLRTGDLGRFDAEGYLSVVGRLKEMLKVGGSNVSPVEIEQRISAFPGVIASAVVGQADERLGQVAVAFVETDGRDGLTEEAITAFCGEGLADYKVPRKVFFVDELPRTDTGKVRRALLAQTSASR